MTGVDIPSMTNFNGAQILIVDAKDITTAMADAVKPERDALPACGFNLPLNGPKQ